MFTSCDRDDLNTDQYGNQISLLSYGPNPVVRGGVLTFKGSNLDQITEIDLPGADPITSINIVTSGTKSEINIEVPAEKCETGIITLKTAKNGEIQTLTPITYIEDLKFTGFYIGEDKENKVGKVGDILTIEGDYLNNITSVIFNNGTTVDAEDFTPGFIMVLHTFGRDLKWNPHIHCLISEGGLSDDGLWRNVHHFNYSFLRSAFRTALLNEMHQRLGDPFKQIKSLCYSSHKKGFYVYAKPSSCDPETAIKYIGRYLGRPVIATSRIDKYDGSMVTFHYNRHEDDKYIQETIPVMDFIKRLIRHIPEKHFKMIRYGGLYARHRKTDQQLHKVISKQKRPILRNFNHWRNAILSSFGYDPLECPICRHKMEFLELYFNHQRLSLEELYERSMSRSRGKRSSA